MHATRNNRVVPCDDPNECPIACRSIPTTFTPRDASRHNAADPNAPSPTTTTSAPHALHPAHPSSPRQVLD